MADIKVQRRGPGPWAWLLAILLLALLAWGATELLDHDPAIEEAPPGLVEADTR